MKMKTLIAVAVAGAFAVPFAAQASADSDRMILAQGGAGSTGSQSSSAPGTGPSKAPTDMTQLDKNNDGYVSRDEATSEQSLSSRFSELDTDNDGRLSRSEWDAMGAPRGSAATGASGTTTPTGGPGVGGTASQRQPVESGGKQ